VAWRAQVSDSKKVRRRLVAVGEHFLLVLKRPNWTSMGLSTAMSVVDKGHLFKLQQFGVFHSKMATGTASRRLPAHLLSAAALSSPALELIGHRELRRLDRCWRKPVMRFAFEEGHARLLACPQTPLVPPFVVGLTQTQALSRLPRVQVS